MTALHIAWFSFKDGTPPERIDRHLQACRDLVGKVPVVINLQCGPSYSKRSGNLTHCIVVTLPDRQALPKYLEHPAHIPVAEALVADVAELQVMDIEV